MERLLFFQSSSCVVALCMVQVSLDFGGIVNCVVSAGWMYVVGKIYCSS